MICPCCGSQYDDLSGVRLFIDRVARGDWYSDRLTRKERRFLEILLDRSPMATSEEVFRHLVWRRPGVTDQNVRQHIHRLRRKLAPIGLGIRNLSGVGYVLTIPELPSAGVPHAQLPADGKGHRPETVEPPPQGSPPDSGAAPVAPALSGV